MAAWMLVAVMLGVSPAFSASPMSRLWGGRSSSEGAASAVLSASGSGYLEVNASKARSPVATPTCAEPCDDYQQGVSPDTETVCIDAFRTCSLAGCGDGVCAQRFIDDCTDHCSEWEDATHETLNVCQDKERGYKCNGNKVCGDTEYRCKQKRVEECFLFCEGYEFSGEHKVDQDSEFVCQNLDSNNVNMGVCMALPCAMSEHNSGNYGGANICRQSLATCKNSCAAGSDEPNSTTVCFDEYSEKCENWEVCPSHMVRCQPTKVHQNFANVDKEDNHFTLLDKQAHKAAFVAKQKAMAAGKDMTQAEWKAEGQKARKQQYAQHHAKDKKSMMRRASLDSGI